MLGCGVDEVWLNLRRCRKPVEGSDEDRHISVLSLIKYVEGAKIANNQVQPLTSRSQPPNLPFFLPNNVIVLYLFRWNSVVP